MMSSLNDVRQDKMTVRLQVNVMCHSELVARDSSLQSSRTFCLAILVLDTGP